MGSRDAVSGGEQTFPAFAGPPGYVDSDSRCPQFVAAVAETESPKEKMGTADDPLLNQTGEGPVNHLARTHLICIMCTKRMKSCFSSASSSIMHAASRLGVAPAVYVLL